MAEAAVTVAAVRLGLSTVRYKRVRNRVDRDAMPQAGDVMNEDGTPGRCAKAVSYAARAVPGASCLTQALALRWMLNRRGIASTLRFGATRAENQALAAHAWLECDGRIVIGGRESPQKYASFGGAK